MKATLSVMVAHCIILSLAARMKAGVFNTAIQAAANTYRLCCVGDGCCDR